MDIEQAMRAMAPLSEEEERLARGLEDGPWPPPLTAADRAEARGVRFAAWIAEEEWRAFLPLPLGEGRGVGDLEHEDAKRREGRSTRL